MALEFFSGRQRGALAMLVLSATVCYGGAGAPSASVVTVVEGVVQLRRPIADAIADAIRFLRKADGAYVPSRIDGELAGYFMSAHVKPDGSRVTTRQLSFPARQHAYFIRTFLHYYVYTGEREWLRSCA